MLLRSSSLVAGLVLVSAASLARAQGCVLDVERPATLRGAKIAIGKLADQGELAHVDEKAKHFKKQYLQRKKQ